MVPLPENDDRYAYLLLTTTFAFPKQSTLKHFTPAEWNRFEEVLLTKGLNPGDLLHLTGEELARDLPEHASRIGDLLKERGKLPILIDNLKNKGMAILGRTDELYPRRLLQLLGKLAPPIFFYAGNLSLLDKDSIGFVGSRDADEAALTFTKAMAARCAREGITVVSGGARGVDQTAMNSALQNGGTAIGYLSDSLEQSIRKPEWRKAIIEGRLLLVSSQLPASPFSIPAAMIRNKYIYTQSRCTIVVASTYKEGGTWAGAKENLKAGWVPLYFRHDSNPDSGNMKLIELGPCWPITDDRVASSAPLSALYLSRGTEAVGQLPVTEVKAADTIVQHTLVDVQVVEAQSVQSDCLDIYSEFCRLLKGLLSAGDKTEGEIAKAMGIKQKSLLERWLEKAKNEAIIVKPGKSKVYRLINPGQNDLAVTGAIDYNLYPHVKIHLSRVLAKHELGYRIINKKLGAGENQVQFWLEQAIAEGFVYYLPKTKKYGLCSEQKKLD